MSNPIVDTALKARREKNNRTNRERPIREAAFKEAAEFLRSKVTDDDRVRSCWVREWASEIDRAAG